MKRLLCKLGFHSWTGWHKVPAFIAGLESGTVKYVHTRRCYDCKRTEFNERV